MRSLVKVMSYLAWLTQLGLSAAVPLAGFVILGVWLHRTHGWGAWTVPVGIVLGLMGAAGGLYSGFKTLHRLSRQEEKPHAEGFNHHD